MPKPSLNGFSFFVKDRKLHLAHNVSGKTAIISSDQLLPEGRIIASVSVTRLNSSESKVTFSINADDAGNEDKDGLEKVTENAPQTTQNSSQIHPGTLPESKCPYLP